MYRTVKLDRGLEGRYRAGLPFPRQETENPLFRGLRPAFPTGRSTRRSHRTGTERPPRRRAQGQKHDATAVPAPFIGKRHGFPPSRNGDQRECRQQGFDNVESLGGEREGDPREGRGKPFPQWARPNTRPHPHLAARHRGGPRAQRGSAARAAPPAPQGLQHFARLPA